MARCAAIKANGERCKLDATGQQGYCWPHDPAHAEERKRNSRRGRPLTEDNLRRRIHDLEQDPRVQASLKFLGT